MNVLKNEMRQVLTKTKRHDIVKKKKTTWPIYTKKIKGKIVGDNTNYNVSLTLHDKRGLWREN